MDRSDSHVLQRLAVVDLARRGEAVRALAEVDLVDVDLEDLVLGEFRLDLEGEQRLVQLSGQGFLRREEKVPGHLHGDGACPLAPPPGDQIRIGRSYDADIIDAGMLVEPVVLGGEDRLLHHRRDVLDADRHAAFLAELADQDAVGGVDAQRDLGLVVGDGVEGGQVGPGEQQDEHADHQSDHAQSGDEGERKGEPAEPLHGRTFPGRTELTPSL